MKDYNSDKYDLILDFINHRLPAKARGLFEAELATDTALKAEIEELRLVQTIAKRNDLREKIKSIQDKKIAEWSEEIEQKSKFKFLTIRNLTRFSAAASVILILFSTFLLNTDVTLPEQQSFKNRGQMNDSSVPKPGTDSYSMGLKAMQKRDYPLAIELLDRTEKDLSIRPYFHDAAKWMKAIAYVESSPETTLDILKEIETQPNFIYRASTIDKFKLKAKAYWNLVTK